MFATGFEFELFRGCFWGEVAGYKSPYSLLWRCNYFGESADGAVWLMNLIKRSNLGSVIEFRLPRYFVYGVVISEDPERGDCVAMFTPKFAAQIDRIGDLYSTPIRYNILFFTKIAASRKNRDVMRVLEKLEIGQLPKIDRRFRVCLAGISEGKKWQILEGGSRKVVDAITPEFALLSEGEIPNLEAIREHYDADYYPWSAALTSRGATTFDPEAFEKINRQSIKKAQVLN